MRVLSPAAPCSRNLSCQRQITVLALPVISMISAVPRPSAVRRTIFARQTCFCGLLRLANCAGPGPATDDLAGLRYDQYKVVFMEQRAHGLELWMQPFMTLPAPKIFNLVQIRLRGGGS